MAAGGRGWGNHRGGEGHRSTHDGADNILNLTGRHTLEAPIQDRLAMRNAAQNRAMLPTAAPQQVQTEAIADPSVSIADPSWAAQAALINDPRGGLAFNPEYPFDGIIAQKSGLNLADPKYEALRTNLAVLRNTMRTNGMSEAKIQGAAMALAEALSNDKWWKGLLARSFPVAVANVEGVGAGEMYKYLLQRQRAPVPLEGLRARMDALFKIPNTNWGLPRLESTPFSPPNLAAPPAAQESPLETDFVRRYLSRAAMPPSLAPGRR